MSLLSYTSITNCKRHLYTKANQKEYYNAYHYTEYVFTSHFNCDNCGEAVTALGTKVEDNSPDESGELLKHIYIKAYHPAPWIIHLPYKCQKQVRAILVASFSLYWMNENSCANKIRVSIESIMDALKIRKMTTGKKKMRQTLHKRIVKYGIKNK